MVSTIKLVIDKINLKLRSKAIRESSTLVYILFKISDRLKSLDMNYIRTSEIRYERINNIDTVDIEVLNKKKKYQLIHY